MFKYVLKENEVEPKRITDLDRGTVLIDNALIRFKKIKGRKEYITYEFSAVYYYLSQDVRRDFDDLFKKFMDDSKDTDTPLEVVKEELYIPSMYSFMISDFTIIVPFRVVKEETCIQSM